MPRPTVWTKESREWLIENYELLGAPACAERLGIRAGTVMATASRMGLRRRGTGRFDRLYYYDGYLYISSANGRYAVHRRLMEQLIGRALRKDEVVHHADGNRANNAPDNLVLTSRASHQGELHAADLSARRDSITGRFLGSKGKEIV